MANNTDWLNISQMTGGTGETALSLTALTNSSLEPKTATITARNTQYNVSDTTTVTIQGFQPTLTLSRSTLRFDSTGGTATFTVYSNTAWTINFPAIVHSYSTSAGTGDTEVSVVVSQNLDEVGKVDTGIVKDVYNVNQLYLTIVQESFITELTVTPDDDIIFANTGSSTSITIDTNTDWEIDYPAWITPSVVSGTSGTTTVILTAPANGPEDRSNEITIYAGSKSVTINAYQPFYIPPYITVTPSSWEFLYLEDGRPFTVDSYPEWTAEIVSSGETVWASETYMEAVFDIPSAMTMPLWVGNNGSTTGVYLGPIIHYGSSVTFPSSGTYAIRYEMLDDGTTPVLQGNQYLKEVYLTDGVGAIQSSAFTDCTALTSVTIGSGLTRVGVGAAAFSGCSSLSDITITAPTAPSVDSTTFKGVARGGTLNYPAGSNYSSWLSFSDNYLGYYNWNNSIENGIQNGELKKYATITYNVTSTSNKTKILSNTYYNFCVKEGDKITVLEGYDATGYTFSNTGKQSLDIYIISGREHRLYIETCNTITDLVVYEVSDSNTRIAGSGTSSITAFTLNQKTNNITSSMPFSKNLLRYEIGGNVSEPYVSKKAGKFVSLTELVISSTALTALPEYSFYESVKLSSVTITSPLQTLNQYCFCGCTALQELVIPSSIKSIRNDCFQNTGFRNITIPDTVQYVGVRCFSNCAHLSAATVGSGLNSIPDYCFQYCTILRNITIKEGITSIGDRAFTRCDSLSSITIPNSVVTLGAGVFMKSFAHTQALSSIIIGSGLTSVGSSCFGGCSLLNSITITAPTAPSLDYYNPFDGISATGTLYYPAGSDYSSWFAKLPSGWTGQEI